LWAVVSAGYPALLSSPYFEQRNDDDDDDDDDGSVQKQAMAIPKSGI